MIIDSSNNANSLSFHALRSRFTNNQPLTSNINVSSQGNTNSQGANQNQGQVGQSATSSKPPSRGYGVR